MLLPGWYICHSGTPRGGVHSLHENTISFYSITGSILNSTAHSLMDASAVARRWNARLRSASASEGVALGPVPWFFLLHVFRLRLSTSLRPAFSWAPSACLIERKAPSLNATRQKLLCVIFLQFRHNSWTEFAEKYRFFTGRILPSSGWKVPAEGQFPWVFAAFAALGDR